MKEILESGLCRAGEFTEVLLNIISLVVIVIGVIASLERSGRNKIAHTENHPRHTHFRRMFGGWLIVALEFQLAADIVGTIITPTYEELVKLGAIALIRTFLNYFLNKELNETQQPTSNTIE
jgi:uncharacterized membrane protein